MISIKRYSSNGPHPRMLAVLLASDDPRTSWLFQLVAKVGLLHSKIFSEQSSFKSDPCVLPTLNYKRGVVVQLGG